MQWKPNSCKLITNNNIPNWKQYVDNSIHNNMAYGFKNLHIDHGHSYLLNLSEFRLCEDFKPGKILHEAMLNVAKMARNIAEQSYMDVHGISSLKSLICEDLKNYNITTSANHLLVTQGVSNSLYIAFRGAFSNDINFYVPSPNFHNTMNLCRTMKLNYDEEGPSLQELKKLYRPKQKGLFYYEGVANWPNTLSTTKKRLKELYNFCSEVKMPILENNFSRDYWLEKPPIDPMKAMDENDLVLYLYSFTVLRYSLWNRC
jgi:GntR family transcriptional regulator of abcA and norABC